MLTLYFAVLARTSARSKVVNTPSDPPWWVLRELYARQVAFACTLRHGESRSSCEALLSISRNARTARATFGLYCVSEMLDHSCQVGRAPLIERRGDCYDTPAVAVHALLKVEQLPHLIWEPACGTGNIVSVLRVAGHEVVATDLNDRGCPNSLDRIDFLLPIKFECDAIVTNPPFALAEKFVAMALERAPLVIMLLRLAFFESSRRSSILENRGLARIHVFAKRLPMMHRAGWEGRKANSGMAFCWMVWDRNYTGPTTIDRLHWEAAE